MNKALIYPYAKYLTPLKYRGTNRHYIIHVINRIRTCRKQISAKLRIADILAFWSLSRFVTKFPPSTSSTRATSVLSPIILSLQTFLSQLLLLTCRKQISAKLRTADNFAFCTYQKLIRKTRNDNSQQILENIGYGLGATP